LDLSPTLLYLHTSNYSLKDRARPIVRCITIPPTIPPPPPQLVDLPLPPLPPPPTLPPLPPPPNLITFLLFPSISFHSNISNRLLKYLRPPTSWDHHKSHHRLPSSILQSLPSLLTVLLQPRLPLRALDLLQDLPPQWEPIALKLSSKKDIFFFSSSFSSACFAGDNPHHRHFDLHIQLFSQ